MKINLKAFTLYILLLIVLTSLGLLLYDWLEFRRFHTSPVNIFCDNTVENVGIQNTRSLQALKYYVNDKERFNTLDPFKIDNFFSDSVHLSSCIDAMLLSKRWNGARSVRVRNDDDQFIITVLSEHIRLIEKDK